MNIWLNTDVSLVKVTRHFFCNLDIKTCFKQHNQGLSIAEERSQLHTLIHMFCKWCVIKFAPLKVPRHFFAVDWNFSRKRTYKSILKVFSSFFLEYVSKSRADSPPDISSARTSPQKQSAEENMENSLLNGKEDRKVLETIIDLKTEF